MRTTLDIDTKILHQIKVLAKANKRSIGRTVSDLARNVMEADPKMQFTLRQAQKILTKGLAKGRTNRGNA